MRNRAVQLWTIERPHRARQGLLDLSTEGLALIEGEELLSFGDAVAQDC